MAGRDDLTRVVANAIGGAIGGYVNAATCYRAADDAMDELLANPDVVLRALQAEQVCEHANVTPACVSCALGWAVDWIESEGY